SQARAVRAGQRRRVRSIRPHGFAVLVHTVASASQACDAADLVGLIADSAKPEPHPSNIQKSNRPGVPASELRPSFPPARPFSKAATTASVFSSSTTRVGAKWLSRG